MHKDLDIWAVGSLDSHFCHNTPIHLVNYSWKYIEYITLKPLYGKTLLINIFDIKYFMDYSFFNYKLSRVLFIKA